MSDEENPSGQLSTTTVSSVAIQAGESRIVISILKVSTVWLTLSMPHSIIAYFLQNIEVYVALLIFAIRDLHF